MVYGSGKSNPGKKTVVKKVAKKKPVARKKASKKPQEVAIGGKLKPKRKKKA